MGLTQAEIGAIADEVVKRLLPALAQQLAGSVPIKPTPPKELQMPVDIEIARVRASGIDPVTYLKAKAKEQRSKKR